jgi:glycosyltransferase involved in cell wall biosynthesis
MFKILHIIPSLAKGGAERLVLDICNEFKKRGDAEIMLMVLHPENDYPQLSAGINICHCPSVVAPSIRKKHSVNLVAFDNIVNEFQPDIIHSHLYEAEMASRWRLFGHIAYVTHCHSNFEQFSNFSLNSLFRKKRLTNFYEKTILCRQYKKCNNHFIVISKDSETYYKNKLPSGLAKNIVRIPNALNYKEFYFDRPPFRKKEQISLVSTGNLNLNKNHAFLISIVHELRLAGHNVSLDIIGEGRERSNLEKSIRLLGLQDHVHLRGQVMNVKDYYQKADIYVHVALHEAFGLSILEAMASGLPVICLDGKGNRDIIVEGKNGFIIMKQDTSLFSSKIMQLSCDTILYDQLSVYARQFAEQFDIGSYCERLMSFYKELFHPAG